jgi:histidine ammonia-lyase
MGMSGARRLDRMLRNLQSILAIELLCACQGIDLLAPLQTGALAQQAYDSIRAVSAKVAEDRALALDINTVSELISSHFFANLLH